MESSRLKQFIDDVSDIPIWRRDYNDPYLKQVFYELISEAMHNRKLQEEAINYFVVKEKGET